MIPKNRNLPQKTLDGELIDENESVGAELDLRDRNQLKLSDSIFKREPCPLDHYNAFTGAELNTPSTKAPRSAEHNKQQYLQSYSVGFPIPSFYVLESSIWSKNADYVLQLVKYVIPEQNNLKVVDHSVQGSSDITSLVAEFETYQDNLWLRVLKIEPTAIETVKEVEIKNCKWAKFQLSADCKIFAIVIPIVDGLDSNRQNHYIYIYEVGDDDPRDLLDLIRKRQYQYRYSDKDMEEDLSFMKELQFDDRNQKLIGIGDRKFFVLDFSLGSISVHSLQTETYEKILHLDYISAENPNNIESRDACFICAKASAQLQIEIFDFFEEKESDQDDGKTARQKKKTSLEDAAKQIAENRFKSFKIDFQNQPTDKFLFRMSKDKDCVFFGDFVEKFVIDISPNGSSKKRKLRHMDNKIIRYIQKDPVNKGFYVICSKEYDNCLELEHTHRDEIDIEFPRQVEPGIIRIFDMQISQEKTQDETTSQISLLFVGMMDDVFTIDKSSYLEKLIEEGDELSLPSYEQLKPQRIMLTSAVVTAFSINWPYVCFSGLNDRLVIYNCFHREYLHRVQLVDEGEKINIKQTYITDTNDLYAMVQNDEYYYLFEIDLDAQDIEHIEELESNINSLYYMGRKQPILQYHCDIVEGEQLNNMLVRGSSRKQKIDFDEKLIVVLLHGLDLYIWVRYAGASNEVRRMQKIAKLQSKNLCRLNDSMFYVMVEKNNYQQVNCFQFNYSSVQETVTYVEEHVTYFVEEFNYDHISNKLLVVCVDRKNEGTWDDQYFLKIFNIDTDEVDCEIKIQSTQLVGRLLSGLYTFVGGHIYYNNNVIKIRYDLMTSNTAHKYSEDELFDEYFDIFKLGDSFKVRSNTPLDSIQSHRFAYIIQDKEKIECMRLMVVPYLHERKVYLNEIKANTDYFYTSIETQISDEEHYNCQLFEQYQKLGITDADDQQRDLKSDATDSQGPVLLSYTAIICLNLSENIFDVYSQNGLLLHQLDYTEHVEKYGEPIAVSNNGQNFIFKHSERTLMSMSEQGIIKDEKQMIVKWLTVSVMNLSAYGFCHIKDISFRSAIKDCLKQLKNEELGDFMEFKNKNKWMFLQTYEEIKASSQMDFRINDEMDVCIKLQEKPEDGKKKHKTIYYIENSCYNLDLDQIKKRNDKCLSLSMEQNIQKIIDDCNLIESNIYYAEEVGIHDFRLNYNYLFIFDRQSIIYMDINMPFCKANIMTINMQMDPDNSECYIEDLRVGSSNQIAIVLAKEGEMTVFSWDIIENAEYDVYDVSVNFEVLWDSTGSIYIIDEQSMIFTNERFKSRSFTFQDISTFEHKDLGVDKGIRVDGKNHNWIILSEFLALPFSYMSFVIKQTIEDNKQVVKVFDPEPYNYIFNRSTSFLDGNFVKIGYSELENILANFQKQDPLMLEILHYTQEVQVMRAQLRDLFNPLTQASNLTGLVSKLIKKCTDRKGNKVDGAEPQPEELVDQLEDPMNVSVMQTGKLSLEINSPLHMAIKEGNNRSVEIILNYMSCINTNNSQSFRDIFHKLMEYKKVKAYISELPRSSNQMSKKQVLKIKSPMSKEIIQMSESNTIYVDQLFYNQKMGEKIENPNYSSYPVKVTAFRIGWMLRSSDGVDGRYFLTEIMRSEDLSFYNMKSLRMIIEFLYQKIKFRIILYLLPVFLANQVSFIVNAMINELIRDNIKPSSDLKMVKGNEIAKGQTPNLIFCLMFNLLFVLIQAYINYLILKGMGLVFFKRIWSWVDITTIILNFVIIGQYWQLVSQRDADGYFEDQYVHYKSRTQNLRINIVFAQMVIFWKAQYFLSIVDNIAPLVGIFVQIIIDIVWFLFILIIFCFSFSFSFFLLAQNQINFDGLSVTEIDGLAYGSFWGAVNYVCNLLIGESDTDPFDLGGKSMKPLLQIIFWLSCFIIMIHMMNMLIAIMGNTFAERNEVVDQIKYKEHMVFVIDNWFMRNLAFKDITQVKYIITAFSTEEEESEDEEYQQLAAKIGQESEVIINNQKKQESKINEVQTMINRQDQLIKQILDMVSEVEEEKASQASQKSQQNSQNNQ